MINLGELISQYTDITFSGIVFASQRHRTPSVLLINLQVGKKWWIRIFLRTILYVGYSIWDSEVFTYLRNDQFKVA